MRTKRTPNYCAFNLVVKEGRWRCIFLENELVVYLEEDREREKKGREVEKVILVQIFF